VLVERDRDLVTGFFENLLGLYEPRKKIRNSRNNFSDERVTES
jgi:hypothetical protein